MLHRGRPNRRRSRLSMELACHDAVRLPQLGRYHADCNRHRDGPASRHHARRRHRARDVAAGSPGAWRRTPRVAWAQSRSGRSGAKREGTIPPIGCWKPDGMECPLILSQPLAGMAAGSLKHSPYPAPAASRRGSRPEHSARRRVEAFIPSFGEAAMPTSRFWLWFVLAVAIACGLVYAVLGYRGGPDRPGQPPPHAIDREQ